jgi:hypothetical protein
MGVLTRAQQKRSETAEYNSAQTSGVERLAAVG